MILNSPAKAKDRLPTQAAPAGKPASQEVAVTAATVPVPQGRSNILGAEEYRARLASASVAKTAAVTADEEQSDRYNSPIAWGLCLISFIGLQLNQRFGMPAAAIFLAPWMLLIAGRIPQMINAVAKDWLVLILPAYALISTVWSIDPTFTMRASVQYGVTLLIGIAAGNLVSRRIILTSMVTALAIMALGGVLFAYKAGGFANIHGTSGLYGAKNQFASSSALLFIGASYLVVYAHKSKIDKMFGAAMAVVALLGIYLGHSAGTMVALAGSLAFTFALAIARKLGGASLVLMGMGVMFVAAVFVMVGANVIFSGALHMVGKNTSLTGRTELWSEALKLIQQHPLLGTGYQALWRLGNPVAEKFWAMFSVPRGSGFNFHNEYLNITVDLGLFGALLLIIVLMLTAIYSIRRRLAKRESLPDALHAMFMFYLILTFAEVTIYYQFFIASIIVCLAWSDRARRQPEQPAASHAKPA